MLSSGDDSELKERILLAAIDEFGRKPYEAASTNAIVSAAGVSKGLLFHYYGSKKQLFMESTYYVLDLLAEYMVRNLDTTTPDMFARLKSALVAKIRFLQDYPRLMGMAESMWYSSSRPEMESHFIDKYGEDYMVSRRLIFTGVDKSQFKDDMDFAKVVEYTTLMIDSGWKRHSEKYADDPGKAIENADEYLNELDDIIDLIKRGAYKE